MVKSNVKDLTVICNDAGFGRKKDKVTGEWKGAARGVGKLVENGQVKKLIASHVGLNPEFGAKYFEGEIDLELVPQGTLAERIRCGGSASTISDTPAITVSAAMAIIGLKFRSDPI